jgi:hypothetical protein
MVGQKKRESDKRKEWNSVGGMGMGIGAGMDVGGWGEFKNFSEEAKTPFEVRENKGNRHGHMHEG